MGVKEFLSKDQVLVWAVSIAGALMGFGMSSVSKSIDEISRVTNETRIEVLVTKANLASFDDNVSRRIEETRQWVEKLSKRIQELERREAAPNNEKP